MTSDDQLRHWVSRAEVGHTASSIARRFTDQTARSPAVRASCSRHGAIYGIHRFPSVMLQADAGHPDQPMVGQVFADWTGSGPLAHLPRRSSPPIQARSHAARPKPGKQLPRKAAQTHRKAAER